MCVFFNAGLILIESHPELVCKVDGYINKQIYIKIKFSPVQLCMTLRHGAHLFFLAKGTSVDQR